jgi:hypothetical protein
MRRRSLLLLGTLTPVALFTSRYLGARISKVSLPTDYRERARQLNELAAEIQTPADARHLVDFVAEIFAEQIPPTWISGSLRDRIAQVEFSAVSDAHRLIPEPRLAEAWNAYVGTVRAPEDHKVTPAEVHNLRDAFLTTARAHWNRGFRNIWAVPSIYAVQPDGVLAPSCRAIESIRVLWDLANMPDNLKAARDRVNKGRLASDLFRQPQGRPPASSVGRCYLEARAFSNPVKVSERQYIKLNGTTAFNNAVITMLDRTFRERPG